MLDAFVAPGFEAIIRRSPELRRAFSDFVLYPDTLAAFSTTSPSIPALLSGIEYDNSEPIKRFLRRALGEASLPAVLERSGYQVDVMSLPQFCPILKQSCTSLGKVAARDPMQEERGELLELLDAALFRALPQALKKAVYRNQRWFLQRLLSDGGSPRALFNSLRFVDVFERSAASSASRPTFKFMHLMLPHPPYRFNARCEPAPRAKEPEKKKYEDQAACALRLAERMLSTLKTLGIYDRSTIVITADHGYSVHYLPFQRPKQLPIMEQALPLFMLKGEGAAGQADGPSISRTPVHLSDLPKTAADILLVEADLPGESVLKLAPGAARVRRYRSYGWRNEFWRRDYLPTMREFLISGDARDAAAWQPGRLLAAPRK